MSFFRRSHSGVAVLGGIKQVKDITARNLPGITPPKNPPKPLADEIKGLDELRDEIETLRAKAESGRAEIAADDCQDRRSYLDGMVVLLQKEGEFWRRFQIADEACLQLRENLAKSFEDRLSAVEAEIRARLGFTHDEIVNVQFYSSDPEWQKARHACYEHPAPWRGYSEENEVRLRYAREVDMEIGNYQRMIELEPERLKFSIKKRAEHSMLDESEDVGYPAVDQRISARNTSVNALLASEKKGRKAVVEL
jgi:hypothetical protein